MLTDRACAGLPRAQTLETEDKTTPTLACITRTWKSRNLVIVNLLLVSFDLPLRSTRL